MEIDLTKENPLGIYPISVQGIWRHEYQFGKTLIFVEYPEGESPDSYIQRAQSHVVQVWNDMQNAVSYAEKVMKDKIPSGWEIFYKKKYPEKEYRVGHWLLVYSIRFCSDLSPPVYFISVNHRAEQDLVLFHEEDYWKDYPKEFEFKFEPFHPNIEIRRVSENIFEVIPDALVA